jgi:hypothetical protein
LQLRSEKTSPCNISTGGLPYNKMKLTEKTEKNIIFRMVAFIFLSQTGSRISENRKNYFEEIKNHKIEENLSNTLSGSFSSQLY